MRPRPDWEERHNERLTRMNAEHDDLDRKMKGCLTGTALGIFAIIVANFMIVALVIWGLYELVQLIRRH